MKGNYFILPNEIFNLKLDAHEFLIYSYLVSCAGQNRVCWPSIQTISRLLNISASTVIRKLDSLVVKQLIDREHTSHISRFGKPRTSNNRYYIRDFSEVWDTHFRFSVS